MYTKVPFACKYGCKCPISRFDVGFNLRNNIYYKIETVHDYGMWTGPSDPHYAHGAWPSKKFEKLAEWIIGHPMTGDRWTPQTEEYASQFPVAEMRKDERKYKLAHQCQIVATFAACAKLVELQGFGDHGDRDGWKSDILSWEKLRSETLRAIEIRKQRYQQSDALQKAIQPRAELPERKQSKVRNPRPYGDRLCEFPGCSKIATCRDHFHDGRPINEQNFRGYVCSGHNGLIGRLDRKVLQATPEAVEYLSRRPWMVLSAIAV